MTATLGQAALRVLLTADGRDKAACTLAHVADWREGRLALGLPVTLPGRPARADRPELLAPRLMPKRRAGGTLENRIALLHALAHIELNAIDLAWDMAARFGRPGLPRDFFDDWLKVAADEARHFLMLDDRLRELGSAYGALPAHDGLWQSAEATAHDAIARLSVVPLVLEARGLDVTPATVARLTRLGDSESARILNLIYEEEISHVAAGRRWLEYFCKEKNLDIIESYQNSIRQYFKGILKPPFNTEARNLAGLPPDFYLPLTDLAG